MGYNPQESLGNTINTYRYHGYPVRGTPNCPLITVRLFAFKTPVPSSPHSLTRWHHGNILFLPRNVGVFKPSKQDTGLQRCKYLLWVYSSTIPHSSFSQNMTNISSWLPIHPSVCSISIENSHIFWAFPTQFIQLDVSPSRRACWLFSCP